MEKIILPSGFIFGAATSATQVEGAAFEEGRTASIWDTLSGKDGTIFDHTTPSVTCDQYHRYQEDAAMMKRLGIMSYRFSFSWSRILPEGTGTPNQQGLDYYKRLLDALDENGIIPNATVYHWDLPEALDQKGGWCNRDVVQWYAEYAALLFKTFGNRIPLWATVNEPIATYIGYSGGHLAPSRGDEATGRQANHHILLAHGEGVRRFRAENLKNSQIGIVVDIWHHHPFRPNHPDDIALAEMENEKTYRSYLDPVFLGHYSNALLTYMEQKGIMPEMRPDDMIRIHEPLDFYGLNCYNRVMDCTEPALMEASADHPTGGNFQENTSEFYPKAVYDAAMILRDRYHLNIPVFVTENGTFNCGEAIEADGRIHDAKRVEYLKGFLSWISRAIRDGIDIRGYYVWSLMDNWEWSAGCALRYGICHTDFDTLERIPKDSALWYQHFIADHVSAYQNK